MSEPTFTPKLGDGFMYRVGNKDYPARIIALDVKSGKSQSIIALVQNGDYESVHYFDADGLASLAGVVRLIDAPPKPVVTQKWLNVYSDGIVGKTHDRRGDADIYRDKSGQCIKLTFRDEKLVEVEICDD